MLLWPAQRKLNLRDQTLLELFLDNVAGGPDTNLYKRLIDSRRAEAESAQRRGRLRGDRQGAPSTSHSGHAGPP